jgi:hypothetical protein
MAHALVSVSFPTDSPVLVACSPISSHLRGRRSGDFQPAVGEGGDSAAGVPPAGITHYDLPTEACYYTRKRRPGLLPLPHQAVISRKNHLTDGQKLNVVRERCHA